MPTDLIRYDLLVQDALKGVVRNVLAETARDGLPGDHHFCITFRTRAPGVKLAQRIQEKHPEELTIILQHQFWDLVVTEQAFEVGLSFGSIPERLVVPFDAVTGFWDPSVQFGLKFEVQDEQGKTGANDEEPPEELAAPDKRTAPSADLGQEKTPAAKPKADSSASESEAKPAASEKPSSSDDKVVSIDAFRKKT